MKSIKQFKNISLILFGLSMFTSGCTMFGLDIQKDYEYKKVFLDEHINMTAWDYLKKRSKGPASADTVFRWMKKAIDYSGIDTMEYMRSNRTYIFLHNDAIMKWDKTAKKVTGGFFLNFPIILTMNPTGLPTTEPAQKWERYSKETVKNYLLYLIGEGDKNFNNIGIEPTVVKSLLPAGTKAGIKIYVGVYDYPCGNARNASYVCSLWLQFSSIWEWCSRNGL